MLASYKLIAQSNTYTNRTDTYRVDIYEYLQDPISTHSFRILGDIKLKRGNSSPTNEFKNFAPSQIDFSILDEGLWLTNRMKGKPESSFLAVVLKNGATLFKGNLLNMLSRYKFMDTKVKVPLKIYDGVTRLKDFKDITLLPAGLATLGAILRTILNSLNYGLDIKLYMNIFPNPNNAALAPAAHIGAKIIDLINNDANPNYYTILEKILKQFSLTLYQENGYWVLRQDVSITDSGTTVSTISSTTGTISRAVEEAYQPIFTEYFQNAPESFFLEAIQKIIFTVECKSPKVDTGDIGWINDQFKEGSRGWTVEANTPAEFNKQSLKMTKTMTSGRVYQTTAHTFMEGDIPIIKFGYLSSRYMIDYDDEGLYAFVAVKFHSNDYNLDFYLKADGTWIQTASAQYFMANQERNFIAVEGGTQAVPGYATVVDEREIEAPIVYGMGEGTITVYLNGGGIPVYNYPYEVSAQHNYCSVRLKSSDPVIQKTDRLEVTTYTDKNASGFSVTVPMHDEDPFITPALYNMNGNTKTRTWGTAALSLLEYLSRELLLYRCTNFEGYDVKILPGTLLNFTYLKSGNLGGFPKNYIVSYQEIDLLADNVRLILIEHTRKNVTFSASKEYAPVGS